jgi:hypothetical protein
MEKKVISEDLVKNIFEKLITEDVSKVKREEFNRVQFKIEELQNSLSETVKELRKLQESIPSPLKTLTNGRISSISSSLVEAQKITSQLKDKIRQHKRNMFSQQVDEKKKK